MLKINSFQNKLIKGEIDLPASKSISHRYLIIKALSNSNEEIHNISKCNDTKLLEFALQCEDNVIDFEDAGTPMRMFLAYAVIKHRLVTITGNDGLKKRPIGPLVDALVQLGCKIEYTENEGYLPVRLIEGINKSISKVIIDSSISSQFVSALLLIGPYLDNGLLIELKEELTSGPYIALTIDCMKQSGVIVIENENGFKVPRKNYLLKSNVTVEADWSSSSFFYAIVAVCSKADLFLRGLRLDSLQGDRVATYLFEFLGVQSKVENEGIRLIKSNFVVPRIRLDFKAMPDMFPALVATCACLEVKASFSGIKNLIYKESNRVQAMKENLEQTGAILNIENEDNASLSYSEGINENYFFKSFNDHRIAMALSIYASKRDIEIDDESVVVKSFPEYWEQLKTLEILN